MYYFITSISTRDTRGLSCTSSLCALQRLYCFRLTQQNRKHEWYVHIHTSLSYIRARTHRSRPGKKFSYKRKKPPHRTNTISSANNLEHFLRLVKRLVLARLDTMYNLTRSKVRRLCTYTHRCVTQVSRTRLNGSYTSKLVGLFFSLTYHSQWKVDLC